MNPSMNPANLSRALSHTSHKPYPAVNPRNIGGRGSGAGLEFQQMVYTPVMVLPTYGGSYMYVPHPVYYSSYMPPFRGNMPVMNAYPAQSLAPMHPPQEPYQPTRLAQSVNEKKGILKRNPYYMGGPAHSASVVENGYANTNMQQSYGYATFQEREDEMEEEEELESAYTKLADNMTVEELYTQISSHLKTYPRVRLSWFNKLLVKVNSTEEFARALDTLEIFTQRILEISPETGTLFIKAACRAGVPEKALAILRALDKVRIWPTLGGIHYLMINFSLKKDTNAVKETFAVAKKRELKPNVRTYQIIIRECVDNNLIDDALAYFKECEEANIVPNRVTYNILMNGLRKAERPNEILAIREKMDKYGLEINETTVKFTSLAYMMLQDVNKAVAEFLKFPDLTEKMELFASKFFEVTEEMSPSQTKCVVDLFDALAQRGTTLPPSVSEKLASLKATPTGN